MVLLFHGFSTFFYSAKNHYRIFHPAKKSLPQKDFKKITTKNLFQNNDILNIFHSSKDFFGKFRSDFSKKITTAVVIFLEKTSPANFKNSPANNFGVRARLRTPVLETTELFYFESQSPSCTNHSNENTTKIIVMNRKSQIWRNFVRKFEIL